MSDSRPAAPTTAAPVDWSAHPAVLFDLDGVVTPTAEVHMRAWARMFNDFLAPVSYTHLTLPTIYSV